MQAEGGFLVQQLGPFLGRYSSSCGFVEELAGASMTAPSGGAGRRLRLPFLSDRPPADPSSQPPLQKGFLLPPRLLPKALLIWDFCQTYRQAACSVPPFSTCYLCVGQNGCFECRARRWCVWVRVHENGGWGVFGVAGASFQVLSCFCRNHPARASSDSGHHLDSR